MAKIETRPTKVPDDFYDPPPYGWEVRESRSRPGVKCFVNLRTGKRQFRRPKPDRTPVDGEESTNSASSEASNNKKEAKAPLLVKSEASTDSTAAEKFIPVSSKGATSVSSKALETLQQTPVSSSASPTKVAQSKRTKASNTHDAVQNTINSKNKEDSEFVKQQTNDSVKDVQENPQAKSIESKKQHVLDEEALYLTDQRNLIGQIAELNDGKPPQTFELYSRIVVLPTFTELEIGSCISFQNPSMKQNQESLSFGVISEIAVLMDRNDNNDSEQVRLRLHQLSPLPEIKTEQAANSFHLSDIPTHAISLKRFQNIVTVAFNSKMRRYCQYYCPAIWSVSRKLAVDVNRSGEFLLTNLCRILFGEVWEPGVDLRLKKLKSTTDSKVNMTRVSSMPMRHVDLEEFDIMDESTWTAKTVDWHI